MPILSHQSVTHGPAKPQALAMHFNVCHGDAEGLR